MVRGGFVTYGKVAGILMLDSRIPRIPGDPGHAQTFPFPVAYRAVEGLPFSDLVEGRLDNADKATEAAASLEADGVSFVAADCGLFSVLQKKIAARLSIPFLGSALALIPLLGTFLPPNRCVGVLTGHTDLLRDHHLRAAGVSPDGIVVAGMENSSEFRKVVIDRGTDLDPEAMREGVREASLELAGRASRKGLGLGAVVLECTNLVSFRDTVQEAAGAPVYDLVSLVELYASGYARREFAETHRSFARG
ncbi:MAG TPA: aspartate/glutamate racemase family protein [Spirochaetia bacterium]|nr:aspartate/glutamate racemase family protein [Spirochaetales bacterium]HRY80295.1 aspartate/glutamate racemase family protein [Spirochaetia bacterium]